MRVFLDANVLFSAAKSDGAVRRLVRELLEQGHECWVDGYVTEEARRNLVAKGAEALQTLDALLPHLQTALAQPAAAHPETAWLPEKDRPVLAAAIRLGCSALVTGDRTHFGSGYGRVFGGVKVLSPRTIFEELLVRPPS